MKIFGQYCLLCLACVITANAQSDKVVKVMKHMKKGEPVSLVLQDYTNDTESAVAFLREMDSLQDDKSRLKVVQFSSALALKSRRTKGQQKVRDQDAFVIAMIALLDKDPCGRVRSAAAKGLLEGGVPKLVDRHNASVLRAVERHKDIDTLLLYASLPSCNKQSLVHIARKIKPDSKRSSYKLNSILARCGDNSATEWLLAEASELSEISNIYLYELVDALSFVSEDRVQKYLAVELRSELYVSLLGGGQIPKRNCFALALVKMNRDNDNFPVKDENYIFNADDLDKIEQWCADELGINVPLEPRKELNVIPSFEPMQE